MNEGYLSGNIYNGRKSSRVPLPDLPGALILSKSAHWFRSNEDMTHLPES